MASEGRRGGERGGGLTGGEEASTLLVSLMTEIVRARTKVVAAGLERTSV